TLGEMTHDLRRRHPAPLRAGGRRQPRHAIHDLAACIVLPDCLHDPLAHPERSSFDGLRMSVEGLSSKTTLQQVTAPSALATSLASTGRIARPLRASRSAVRGNAFG